MKLEEIGLGQVTWDSTTWIWFQICFITFEMLEGTKTQIHIKDEESSRTGILNVCSSAARIRPVWHVMQPNSHFQACLPTGVTNQRRRWWQRQQQQEWEQWAVMGRWDCCCVFPRNPAAPLFQLKHLGKSSSGTVYEFFLPQIQTWYAKCFAQNPEAPDLQLLLVCFGLCFTLAKTTLQTTSSFGSLFKCQLDFDMCDFRKCRVLLCFWIATRPEITSDFWWGRCMPTSCVNPTARAPGVKWPWNSFFPAEDWNPDGCSHVCSAAHMSKRRLTSVAGEQCWVAPSQPLRFQPNVELKRPALRSTM